LNLPREYASMVTLGLLLAVLYVSIRWADPKTSANSS
jgi:hypothetical protein